MLERKQNLERKEISQKNLGRAQRIGEIAEEVWNYRELLYFLIWKEIKVKYKQTTLGIAWAVLQPLIAMALFTVVFGKLAKLPNDGIPYPVFYYSSLICWTYFSTALNSAANSVVNNSAVISKVYFPRIFLPAAGVVGGLVDLSITVIILFCLLAYYSVPVTFGIMLLPLVFIVLMVFAFGTGLFLSALNVNFRDVRHALPFVVQVWMFASPVVYPASMFPEKYRWLLPLNPITGIIETSRAVIANQDIPWHFFGMSCLLTCLMLVFGLWYFRCTERKFADII